MLKKIKNKLFRFLCTRKREKEVINLVKWNKIAKPKEVVGWGLMAYIALDRPWYQKQNGGW
jgi:hypothetical protein